MAVATVAKEKTDANDRPLRIEPENVQEQVAGLCWTEYLVTMPPGMVLQDLDDPRVWRNVQGFGSARSGLRPLDRLSIIDFDMTFLVEARVCSATEEGASISIIKKVDLPQRNMNLPEIETHRLAYSGRAYVVVNKKTGRPVGAHYVSLAEATRALYAQAPKLHV
jgi:hypothetical protein